MCVFGGGERVILVYQLCNRSLGYVDIYEQGRNIDANKKIQRDCIVFRMRLHWDKGMIIDGESYSD